MSFTSFDFPHTHYYDSDLRELLRMYKELRDKYNGLVSDIEDLKEWRTEHIKEYEALVKRMDELEEELKEFEVLIERKFNELSDSIHADFNNLSDELKRELEAALAEYERLYNALRNEVMAEIDQMKLELIRLMSELRTAIAEFRTEMVDYIDERFELFIQSLPDYEHLIVHNPVTGKDTTIQEALNDLYASFNVFGLTAREFDTLEITCAEFDALGITAHEFDSLGYKLLHYPDPTYYMRDPFTGEWALVSDVVMKLFALHAGTLTCDEFEALDLTCEEFDAKETTAFNFDFFGVAA